MIHRPTTTLLRAATLPLALVVLCGVLPGAPAQAKKKMAEAKTPDDLMIVDCLLPPKVRRLGRQSSYLSARQPIRTTAVDCRIRGGEYTEPDQANYATSLKVWLPQAEAGDAEAQFYVGQIFDKGLGTTPDYESAENWYRKAAEQDYTPAQINLGYLYEEGLGVEQDDVAALNWYRRAAGLAEDMVVLEAGEFEALTRARVDLEMKTEEADELKLQVDELRRQLSDEQATSDDERKRQATLRGLLDKLEQDLQLSQQQIADDSRRIAELEQRADNAERVAAAGVALTALGDIPFGRYHALVIGNSQYRNLPPLESAADEARELSNMLRGKYGFEVDLLIDADRFQIMSALNELRQDLTHRDNLLVYYAGHGERDESGRTAFWQPVDAEPRNTANWIPSGVVTEHLDLIAANHVFLVANSVFAGLRTRSSIAQLPQGMTEEEHKQHVKAMTEKRTRLVLAAGDRANRANAEGQSFSSALLEALRDNDGLLEASSLYRAVNDTLTTDGAASGLQFATMRWARNDLADFFFVPADLR